ncbi:MAG TPA: RidA family protein [Solirubrobacteraceae bacterium]|jgi:enamine deaminase RidA (YjgF/YER057c/UK114 family)|nr:RidA family protein [Solirubrobacteraceae bacterium]
MNPSSRPHVAAVRTEPDRYEPFAISQGFRVGDLLFISGQAASDDEGNVVGLGDFEAQGHQAFHNLQRALEAGGSSLADVVKVTIFVSGAWSFDVVVALRRQYFTAPYPADSLVEVRGLSRPELMIEIEAIAVCRDGAG